jgi:hypothetical protein
MATQTRNPTSDEALSGSWGGTANNRYTLVDDFPDNSGDNLGHGTTAGNITFGFSAFSIPSGASNISVKVSYYDFKTASQSCNIGGRIKVGGSYYNASTHNPTNGTAVLREDTWATNPATGAAWTVSDINSSLTAFGLNSTDASPTIGIYSIQLTVTYTVAYSLAADSAAFTFTGASLGLLAGLLMTAASGSMALTGQDVTLTKAGGTNDYTITADSGSYVLGGTTSSLELGRKIAADSATYLLTGQDVSLEKGSKVVADPGAVVFTGQSTSLTAQRKVTADSGAYSFTGQDVTLTYEQSGGYTIATDSGGFTFSGQDVSLKYNRIMSADSGSYVLTGSSAGLTYAEPSRAGNVRIKYGYIVRMNPKFNRYK